MIPSDLPARPVIETGDIEFARVTDSTGELVTLRFDLYQPPEPSNGPHPTVLWFHGGGFQQGNDKRQRYIPWLAREFAGRGYVGIAPDYRVRSAPLTNWHGAVFEAVEDGRAALDWAIANCTAYRIDTQRIVLAGGSAGAMLALNLAAGLPPHLVRAVLNLWGTPPPKARLFGLPGADFPPTFLVHGTADQLVPIDLSIDFVNELAQAGVRYEFLTLADAPHTPLNHMDKIIRAIEKFLQDVLE